MLVYVERTECFNSLPDYRIQVPLLYLLFILIIFAVHLTIHLMSGPFKALYSIIAPNSYYSLNCLNSLLIVIPLIG